MSSFLIDTNVLIYAVDSGNTHQARALDVLERAGASRDAWCLSWQNVCEFVAVVTNPRAFQGKSLSLKDAMENAAAILDAPNLRLLVEEEGFWAVFREVIETSRGTSGALVHDCRLAALLKQHGVKRIITADAGFVRFPFLKVENPLREQVSF